MALSNGNVDGIELESLSRRESRRDGSLVAGVATVLGSSEGASAGGGGSLCTTPKPKRAAVTKKLQFTTPEFSVTPIPTASSSHRLTPSRRR